MQKQDLNHQPSKPSYVGRLHYSLLLGLAVLTLLFWLPYYVGALLWIVVSILGAGAIILGIKNCRRETVAMRQVAGSTEEKPPAE